MRRPCSPITSRACMERNAGYDPVLADWESAVLPITPIPQMAESVGFEPTVPYDITGFQDQHNKPLCQLSVLHCCWPCLPWCSARDLNSHAIPDRSFRDFRVCQFHQPSACASEWIRTTGGCSHAGLANQCIKPLCHGCIYGANCGNCPHTSGVRNLYSSG